MTLKNLDVSIILVSYNTLEYTRNCLKSIYEKTQNINFDVWVVDNNSSDNTCEMIKNLGGKAEVTADTLTVYGSGELEGGTVDSFNDHRIVMMAAAASSLCGSPVLIKGAEAVSKSYPGFFEDAGLLGLKYHLEER